MKKSSNFHIFSYIIQHVDSNFYTHSMRQVACPQCNRLSEFTTTNPFRPFCSERCKLIDLGQWANESYKIPSAKPIDENDNLSDLDSTNLS